MYIVLNDTLIHLQTANGSTLSGTPENMMKRSTCEIVTPVNEQEHSMGSGWRKESCLSLSRKPQQNGPEKALWEAQHIQLWPAAYFKRFSSVSFGLGFQENSYCCMDRHAYEARGSFYVCSWGLTWANVWFVSLCFPSREVVRLKWKKRPSPSRSWKKNSHSVKKPQWDSVTK